MKKKYFFIGMMIILALAISVVAPYFSSSSRYESPSPNSGGNLNWTNSTDVDFFKSSVTISNGFVGLNETSYLTAPKAPASGISSRGGGCGLHDDLIICAYFVSGNTHGIMTYNITNSSYNFTQFPEFSYRVSAGSEPISVVVIDDAVYFLSGDGGASAVVLKRYNLSNGTLQNISSYVGGFGGTALGVSSCKAWRDSIICAGGETTGGGIDDVFRFNLSNGTAQEITVLPNPAREMDSVLIDDAIYFIGGQRGGGITNSKVIRYNVTNNTAQYMSSTIFDGWFSAVYLDLKPNPSIVIFNATSVVPNVYYYNHLSDQFGSSGVNFSSSEVASAIVIQNNCVNVSSKAYCMITKTDNSFLGFVTYFGNSTSKILESSVIPLSFSAVPAINLTVNQSVPEGTNVTYEVSLDNGVNYVTFNGNGSREWTPAVFSSLRMRIHFNSTNTSVLPFVYNFFIGNTTVPRIPVIAYPTNGLVLGNNNLSSNVTNISSVTTFYWYTDGEFNHTTTTNSTLNFTDGTHNLTVASYDGLGWSSNASYVNFTIDTIVPAVFGNSSLATTVDTAGNISVNVTDTGSNITSVTVEVTNDTGSNGDKTNYTMTFLSGSNVAGVTSVWSYSYTSDGARVFVARFWATDFAGNVYKTPDNTLEWTASAAGNGGGGGGGGGSPSVFTTVQVLNVTKGFCGDNTCSGSAGEDVLNCPQDCSGFGGVEVGAAAKFILFIMGAVFVYFLFGRKVAKGLKSVKFKKRGKWIPEGWNDGKRLV